MTIKYNLIVPSASREAIKEEKISRMEKAFGVLVPYVHKKERLSSKIMRVKPHRNEKINSKIYGLEVEARDESTFNNFMKYYNLQKN